MVSGIAIKQTGASMMSNRIKHIEKPGAQRFRLLLILPNHDRVHVVHHLIGDCGSIKINPVKLV